MEGEGFLVMWSKQPAIYSHTPMPERRAHTDDDEETTRRRRGGDAAAAARLGTREPFRASCGTFGGRAADAQRRERAAQGAGDDGRWTEACVPTCNANRGPPWSSCGSEKPGGYKPVDRLPLVRRSTAHSRSRLRFVPCTL